MAFELRAHQQDAIGKMHNGCVLWGGTGTGKTYTALGYALQREKGRKVVVITTAKKRNSLDWVREAATIGFPVDDIVIDSWNNIGKYVDLEDHLFILDEQRIVGKGAWVKGFFKIAKKNRWVLLSATPGDTWSDYAPLFVANGWYKSLSEFNRAHAVYSRYTTYPKIERYVDTGILQKYRKSILVEMPMERHTTRHMHYIECDYDVELLDVVRKQRWNVYEDRPLKNAADLFSVMRRVVSTDSDRVTKLESLFKDHPRLIVFYNYDYELEILRKMCRRIEKDRGLTTAPSISEGYEPTQTGSTSVEIAKRGDQTTSSPQDHSSIILDSKRSTKYEWPKLSENLNNSTSELAEQTLLTSMSTEKRLVSLPHQSHPKSKTPNTTQNKTSGSSEMVVVEGSGSIPTESLSTANTRTGSFAWAEYNGHKHEAVPETDSWIYLAQYMSASESWNCITTDTIVFWSLTYSWKQFAQAQGRTDRMNTPFKDLHYYIMLTDSRAEKPVIASLNRKQDFQPR